MATEKTSFFIGHDTRVLPQNPNQIDPYLGPLENGYPEHITLAPPVTLNEENLRLELQKLDAVCNELAECARTLAAIDSIIGSNVYFGQQALSLSGLKPLHHVVMSVLHSGGFGGQFDDTYTGFAYNAHITHTGFFVPRKKVVCVDSVSVFLNEKGKKNIIRRYPLEGGR